MPPPWLAASAASIQNSAFCKNHPARSPVMPPNSLTATRWYRHSTSSAAATSAPPPRAMRAAASRTDRTISIFLTLSLSAAVAKVWSRPVFLAMGNAATASPERPRSSTSASVQHNPTRGEKRIQNPTQKYARK